MAGRCWLMAFPSSLSRARIWDTRLDGREPLMLTPAEWTVLNGGELLSKAVTYK